MSFFLLIGYFAGWLHQLATDHLTARRAATSLHELDGRALADIGVDASEIGSIEAEQRGLSASTRRRIVATIGHA